MLPHSVDLVIFGQVSDPDLKAHIQQAGVVFYQRGALIPIAEPKFTNNSS
jgi:hypothetical protein